MNSKNIDQTRVKVYTDYLDAILRFDVERSGLALNPKARSYWQERIMEFFDGTSEMIFKIKQRNIDDLSRGAQIVSGSAISHAMDAGRRTVLAEDVEYALRVHFCTVWPFCRKH